MDADDDDEEEEKNACSDSRMERGKDHLKDNKSVRTEMSSDARGDSRLAVLALASHICDIVEKVSDLCSAIWCGVMCCVVRCCVLCSDTVCSVENGVLYSVIHHTEVHTPPPSSVQINQPLNTHLTLLCPLSGERKTP